MAKKKRRSFGIDYASMSFDIGSSFASASDEEREFIRAAKLQRRPVMFDNAADMVNGIDITQDYFCFVSGSFIFGDLIEALCYVHDLKPAAVYITTLGMSADNIDSIVNLTECLDCKSVRLIVSNYFTALERDKLIPYMVQEFSGQPIKVAVLASHSKICLIESDKGNIIIEGSANLSSSCNVEQFSIIHDDGLFAWLRERLDGIVESFMVIDGLSGETIFTNDRDNTGRKAFEHLRKGVSDKWQVQDGRVQRKKQPQRKAHPQKPDG